MTKDQAITVTDEMITAEGVEDLYRRGTPDTWRVVYIAMSRAAPPAPDCRTCQLKESCEYDAKVWNRCYCTNGDKYEEAPAVVLWRTE